MKKILENKALATALVTGVLSVVAGIWLLIVAVFHVEPFLSSWEERISAFVHYGGMGGLIPLLFGVGLLLYVLRIIRQP
jgi:hypothetical protein